MPLSNQLLERIKRKDPTLQTINLSSQYPLLDGDDITLLVNSITHSSNDNIKTLVLNDNEIDDEGVAQLAKLQSLEKLSLGNNAVTDKGIQFINKLSKLEFLDVSANQITDIGFESLLEMPNIKTLAIAGNKITDASVAKILANQTLTSLIFDKIDSIHIENINQHICTNQNRVKSPSLASQSDNFVIKADRIDEVIENQMLQLQLLLNILPENQRILYQEKIYKMFAFEEKNRNRFPSIF